MDQKRDLQLAPGVGSQLIQGHGFINVFLLPPDIKLKSRPSTRAMSFTIHIVLKWGPLFTAGILEVELMVCNILLVPLRCLLFVNYVQHVLT